MATLMLDTHVVAWLYSGRIDKLPEKAKGRLESDALMVSPMVVLELQYLYEIGRLAVGADVVIEDLGRRIGLSLCDTPFDIIARAALALSWARDPFDRLIAAQCLVEQAPLLTADGNLREHLSLAIWE